MVTGIKRLKIRHIASYDLGDALIAANEIIPLSAEITDYDPFVKDGYKSEALWKIDTWVMMLVREGLLNHEELEKVDELSNDELEQLHNLLLY